MPAIKLHVCFHRNSRFESSRFAAIRQQKNKVLCPVTLLTLNLCSYPKLFIWLEKENGNIEVWVTGEVKPELRNWWGGHVQKGGEDAFDYICLEAFDYICLERANYRVRSLRSWIAAQSESEKCFAECQLCQLEFGGNPITTVIVAMRLKFSSCSGISKHRLDRCHFTTSSPYLKILTSV